MAQIDDLYMVNTILNTMIKMAVVIKIKHHDAWT
jgi:hypothetical protein